MAAHLHYEGIYCSARSIWVNVNLLTSCLFPFAYSRQSRLIYDDSILRSLRSRCIPPDIVEPEQNFILVRDRLHAPLAAGESAMKFKRSYLNKTKHPHEFHLLMIILQPFAYCGRARNRDTRMLPKPVLRLPLKRWKTPLHNPAAPLR